MTKSGAKRFYKAASVVEGDGGFAVCLDGMIVKTPGGKRLVAPSQGLAAAVAAEWDQQGPEIDPSSMHMTKALNTTLDRTGIHRAAIVEDLTGFARTDLLCYRATAPENLVVRQRELWDPWLTWAVEKYGATLTVGSGVMHIAQPPETIERLGEVIDGHDDFRLTALHTAITVTGSVILGLALINRAATADTVFALSHLDELYQAERWGQDAEAEHARGRRLDELRAARRYVDLL
jgi:chaperone required for assembly of F1-ATPase